MHSCCSPVWFCWGVHVNVTKYNDGFVTTSVRLLTSIPSIPDNTTISVILLILELHELSAEILKLFETLTVTSKQPDKGMMIGGLKHVGRGIT